MSKDILERAKKFRDEAQAYWQPIYDQGREDKRFVVEKGAQWDAQAIAKRKAEGKPTLEFNLVHTYCRQQVNTHKQNRPQIQVVPVDNGADDDKAKVLGGLIKDTEEASNFEDANDIAVENAVYSAVGFIRVVTDYLHEKSFNQEPRYKAVHNPEAVLIDPLSREMDGSDMAQAIVGEWVSKDSIERQYGEDAVSDFEMEGVENWFNDTNSTVFIAEYFYKEEVKDTLIQLEDNTVDFKSALLEMLSEEELKAFTVNERETTRTEIKWVKLSGCKVLEESIFPGKYIPIIPVYGEVIWIGEKRHVFSLVHFAKDPQKLFNYWKSTEANILQKNQDEWTVVDSKAIEGYDEWEDPAKARYLRFDFIDEAGKQRPAPMKVGSAQVPVGILNASESAKALIADTLNMHAPQMGQEINQQSGRAIGLLQRQGETSQFHFQDNDNKSIRHCGRILLGLYPVLYDVPLVKRIIGLDGEVETVKLNTPPDQNNPDEMEKAINGVLNDMSIGRFDVRMDTGPSFNTQREQSFQLLMQLAQFAPNIMQSAGDLILKDSPLLNAKAIAERVKKMMPPQVFGNEQLNPEQAKAQITQLDQLVQKLTGELDALQKEVGDKTEDRNVEMLKAQLQAEKDIQVAQINASSRSDVQELRGVVELLKQRIDLANAPNNWLQQGEGVDGYAPSQSYENPQLDGFDPPPDIATTDIQNPAIEQGFLMPNEMDQQNFAPNTDQVGDSALINPDIELMSNPNNGESYDV
ncbi:portal protein [Acinetobacter sp. WCHAc060025]|uniref:portal protein n=1 Tax=Acinetobacter sp. WCHAc060025 TaxID=2518625 RepID=UPI001023388B|nr:portal protein [Acinetobacter sp. WCHAc060025]RZG74742.1 portal protein p19 [Acinetobacter sp. WCHAc060025]